MDLSIHEELSSSPEVESQQVDWLWQTRIPLGKITLLDGDPSQVLLLDNIEQLNIKDTKKIKFGERPFSLSQDLGILEQAIKQTKTILVVIDPLMAVLVPWKRLYWHHCGGAYRSTSRSRPRR